MRWWKKLKPAPYIRCTQIDHNGNTFFDATGLCNANEVVDIIRSQFPIVNGLELFSCREIGTTKNHFYAMFVKPFETKTKCQTLLQRIVDENISQFQPSSILLDAPGSISTPSAD